MSNLKLSVTVDEEHLSATDRIAGELVSKGFKVERTFPEIGAIYGTASDVVAKMIAQIPGIQDVRISEKVQLAPTPWRIR